MSYDPLGYITTPNPQAQLQQAVGDNQINQLKFGRPAHDIAPMNMRAMKTANSPQRFSKVHGGGFNDAREIERSANKAINLPFGWPS